MGRKYDSWLKKAWRVFYPLLAYEAIGLLLQMFTAFAISIKLMLGTNLEDLLGSEMGYVQFLNRVLESFYSKMYYVLIASALLTIPLMMWFIRRDRKARAAWGQRPAQLQVPSITYILVAVVAFGACIGGNNLILSSGLIEIDENYQQLSALLYSAPMWFQLLGTGVIIPVCEELIFRGLMYDRMKEYMEVRWALIASALLFGIGHGNLVQGLYGAALGYLMASLYEKTGKLWVPVLFHIVANTLSVLITETTMFQLLYYNEITVLLSGAAGVLIAMAGFVGIQRVLDGSSWSEMGTRQ